MSRKDLKGGLKSILFFTYILDGLRSMKYQLVNLVFRDISRIWR